MLNNESARPKLPTAVTFICGLCCCCSTGGIYDFSDFLNMSFFLSCLDACLDATSFPLRMSSCSCFSGHENQVQCKRPPGLILTCRSTGGFVSAAPNLVNYLFQSGLFLHRTPAAIHNVDQITRRQTLSLKH